MMMMTDLCYCMYLAWIALDKALLLNCPLLQLLGINPKPNSQLFFIPKILSTSGIMKQALEFTAENSKPHTHTRERERERERESHEAWTCGGMLFFLLHIFFFSELELCFLRFLRSCCGGMEFLAWVF